MMSRYQLSNRLTPTLPVMAVLILVGYFGWHAASGERGLGALHVLEREIRLGDNDLADLRHERDALKRRVDLISGPEVDGDLLEEEVRRLLGWTRANEIVILNGR